MRWKQPTEAKLGDERTVRRFLWWSLTLEGETRWLERASIRQVYQKTKYWYSSLQMSFYRDEWVDVGWADSVSS